MWTEDTQRCLCSRVFCIHVILKKKNRNFKKKKRAKQECHVGQWRRTYVLRDVVKQGALLPGAQFKESECERVHVQLCLISIHISSEAEDMSRDRYGDAAFYTLLLVWSGRGSDAVR